MFRFNKSFIIRQNYNKERETICIHAASGEIEYAYPLIKKIKDLNPHINIVVTLSSPSVLAALKNNTNIDAFGPAPIDTTMAVKNFISQWKPKMVLFSRTDIWPEFIYQLTNNKIPTYIFSCTLADDSSRLSFISRTMTRFCFNKLNGIFTVSTEDKSNLKNIGVTSPIEILGDTRFDQIELKKKNQTELKNLFPINSQQEEETLKDDHAYSTKKIFIAGSSWEQDEQVIFPVFKAMTNWKWIIAPHEVDVKHLTKIKSLLEQHFPQGKVQFYSTFDETKEWDVIIVDQFGKLFSLYEYADASFVGGSFKDKVHSVMEPLAYNKYVFVGPHFQNNREAIEFSKTKLFSELSMVQVFNSSEELKNMLTYIENLKSDAKVRDYSKINETLELKKKATDRVYKFIFNTL